MSHEPQSLEPTRAIAQRVKKLRGRLGLTAAQLAERMNAVGFRWDRFTVQNLENGRRRNVTVEEFLALAYVLSVAPVHLLVPIDAEQTDLYAATPEGQGSRMQTTFARSWVRGHGAATGQDRRVYFSEVPDVDWDRERPGVEKMEWSPDMADGVRRDIEEGRIDPERGRALLAFLESLRHGER
ncbi:helix-turn-helix domain-containing protein [Micromonospora sp. MS34]|uniref:helix-turn-helix domain-containing protein n=1 Tax=Micromonospora sp. MS34 TaxID=3385971 RepID=UPI0039A33592